MPSLSLSRRHALGLAAGAAAAAAFPNIARAQASKIKFLIPAPGVLPAFASFHIALKRGYFKDEGVDIDLTTVTGGAEVAKQVGAQNAEMGNALGDTPIIVRANGVPVRSCGLMGGRSMMKLVWRKDRGITGPKDLKGKTVTVLAYTDTTYYSLLGVLAKVGLTKNDVNIQAVGPAAVTQLVIAGSADAMAGVGEWLLQIEGAGTPVGWVSSEQFFPSMAQAVLVSDAVMKSNPKLVAGVTRATLRGVKAIMDNVDSAAVDYVAAVPAHAGKEAEMKKMLGFYAQYVYPGQKRLGEMDAKRLASVQDFYAQAGIIEKKTPIDELYTNQFL